MCLSDSSGEPRDADPGASEPASLRYRMVQAGWLFGSAGVLCFLGFLLVAVGLAQPIEISSFSGFGSGILSGFVPWGFGLIGFGVMLGFFGAAVKGPSKEWAEIAVEPDSEERLSLGPAGFRYACPGCGSDVYGNQTQCPACGHLLRGASQSRG